jgi:hypothetical protein
MRQDAHRDHEEFFRNPVADDTDDRRQRESQHESMGFQPGDEICEMAQHDVDYSGAEGETGGIRNSE